jgi:ribose 5-phosphate isomerase B
MRIAVGCDHRGLELKQFVMKLVTEAGHSVNDFGCYSTDSVDYPDIAQRVAGSVATGDFDHGILMCHSGVGMSIAANKVRGIRAALCHDAFTACRARKHNDANILCLSAEPPLDMIREVVEGYLTSEFEGGRHGRRVNKIRAIEG